MLSETTALRKIIKLPHGGAVPSPEDQQEQLPCPRCDSTNTKFCYYNNYNFSQPRHFCKSCRRYWTQGGTLRDIPSVAFLVKALNVPGFVPPPLASPPLEAGTSRYKQRLLSSNNGCITSEKGTTLSFSGGFTSLLNYNGGVNRNGHRGGLNGLDGYGLGLGHGSFYDDVRFGQGITVWPFSAATSDAATTTSHVATIPTRGSLKVQKAKSGSCMETT